MTNTTYDALTIATSRLRAWQDWTARILSPEVLAKTASLSTLIAETTDRDPHVPYRAAVLGAFATLQDEVDAAKQSADGLEDLARHYKAEVDAMRAELETMQWRHAALAKGSAKTFAALRTAVEEMLMASVEADDGDDVPLHEAAAKVGAYLDYGTHDNPDVRVRWRLDDRKDGDA